MILLNDKFQEITLKAVFKNDKFHKFIIPKDSITTFISEEKTIYVYFEQLLNFKKTFSFIQKFLKINNYSINIDVNTFQKNNSLNYNIFTALTEGLFYGLNDQFSLKTIKKNKNLKYNLIYKNNNFDVNKLFEIIKIKMYSVNLARSLQDSPPNLMNPKIFTYKINHIVKNIDNLKITILNKKDIKQMKMKLLLSVSAGSYFDPYIVVIEYTGDITNKEKIGLIGKGITFDSGGYNLKPTNSLIDMKFDMSGAAIVCSSIIALAKVKSKYNIIAIACLSENKIGGKAILPESIIKSMSGKTVQIDNTDAEGRLILADSITYALNKLNVNKIIEISTLTGAILITLGKYMTGVFSNNEEWYQKFANAANTANEEIWRLPIHEFNVQIIKKTTIADLTNAESSKMGSSSNAAAFLCEFAQNKPFIHLDIAGTANDDDHRGTGIMVKTLFEMFF